jgi:hypothetical protein
LVLFTNSIFIKATSLMGNSFDKLGITVVLLLVFN